MATVFGEQVHVVKDKRARLLEIFRTRHGFFLPIANQPSEQTLGLLIKLQETRCVEFFPLSRVTNYAEGRGIKVEPAKIKGIAFLMEKETISLTAKNRDFLVSAVAFSTRTGYICTDTR